VVSYIEKSLGANEAIHYRARFHWLYYAAAWGALIIAIVVAVVAMGVSDSSNSGWVALVVLLAGGAIFLAVMGPIWTTEIGVTNQRIIYKRGFIQRETNELQLRNIEEVRFDQDFLGRLLGYGSLQIHGTGDDMIQLPAVADPLALRSALQGAMGDAQGSPPPAPNGQTPPPGQPAIQASSA
jgi:uncharacterized membrane protein YdbT with pleckstrin-like domain